MSDAATTIAKDSFNGIRGRVQRVVEAPWFQRAIAGVIVFNAVTLGLETSPTAMAAAGTVLIALDRLALAIFVLEIALKLFVYRWAFFKSGWNVFDFVIVGISLIPASGNLSVMRALRILRVLRLLSVVPQMRSVVSALLQAIPGMASVVAVLVLVFYVAAVLATKLFGVSTDANLQEWFGTIGRSMYSLFQIMTLESWSMGIVRPTMEIYPWSWMFFVPFIVLTSFAVLNLFIAIIVNAMQSEHEAEHDKALAEVRAANHEEAEAMASELRALRGEIAELKDLLRDGRR